MYIVVSIDLRNQNVYQENVYMSCVQQTVEAWRIVFYIAASVYAFGTIIYALFGSGELQPWASPDSIVYGVQSTENETEEVSHHLIDTTGDSLPAKQNVCCNSDLCTKL